MRVEQVQNNLQPSQQVQNEQQLPASFQKGEVVKATVLAQDGETYTLRTEDGRLFKAKLQLDTVLLPQDTVEFVVTAKGDGQMRMQMLSIISSEAHAPSVSQGSGLLESLGLADSPQASSLLDAMQQMGVSVNKQTLLNALQIMQDTGLSPKAAVFFAANQIPATEETVKAFLDMQQGQTTGVVLHEIAQEAATLEGLAPQLPGEVPQEGAPPAQAAQATAPQPGAELPQGAAQAATLEATPLPAEAAPAQTPPAAQAPPQEGAPQAAPAGPEQAPQPQAAAQSAPPPEAQTAAAPQASAQAAAPVPPQQQAQELGALSQRLLAMFMEVDASMDGAKVKKAAAETALRTELLKDMMQTAEGRSSGIAGRMGDVAAQTKLTQDVQRFYCLHIPIQHQSPDTAELYIYKNRKGGKGIDPEDTSILLGLHTETMGRVESLLRVEKRNLSLVFSVENEEAIPFMKEHTRELYPLLREHRYVLLDAKVRRLEQATTLETAEEVLSAAVAKPHVYVDTKI